MTRRVRILSLDGGGVRGALTAAFLAHLERHLAQTNLVAHFDLVVGTSTGAIIALGLAAGIPAREILRAYSEAGPQIFKKRSNFAHKLWGPAHSNAALKRWLQQFLGGKRIGDALVPVAIPTFDASTGSPRVWKTNHHEKLHSGAEKLMWEVALASAAAPTYLPATTIDGAGAYLDGGLWANNPTMVAVTEAVRYLGARREDITVLSVGTGRRKTWLKLDEVKSRGALGWSQSIVDIVFEAQSEATHQQARLLLEPDRYLRIDVELTREVPLDDAKEIDGLTHLGTTLGERHLNDVKRLLTR